MRMCSCGPLQGSAAHGEGVIDGLLGLVLLAAGRGGADLLDLCADGGAGVDHCAPSSMRGRSVCVVCVITLACPMMCRKRLISWTSSMTTSEFRGTMDA